MDPDARKGRVTAVTFGRLHSCGFALGTLDDVVRAADLGEAELQAVFGDREGLIKELVGPLRAGVREVATSAAEADLSERGRLRVVVQTYLDVMLAHRPLVNVVLGPSGAASESVRLVRAAMADLRDTLAKGLGPGLDHQIRAAAALGAVQAAVIELTEFDPTTVRDVIVDAAVAILLS